jgi:hypothetical protein
MNADERRSNQRLSAFIRVSIKAQSGIALFENSRPPQFADRIRQLGFVMMLGNDQIIVAQ